MILFIFCSNFLGIENKVAWLKKDTNKIKTCPKIFIVYYYYIILHTKIQPINKKESWQLVEKQKSYWKLENVKKMPKKLKIYSLKIHKDAGILKKSQNLPK